MIFGGIANSVYGYPRQTFDIDVKIILDLKKEWEQFYNNLKEVSHIFPDSPKSFILETKVLPIEIEEVRIDLILAELPYEINAIQNSIQTKIFGVETKVCQVEDLIIQKAISEREKDWLDIAEIVKIQKDNMNWEYIMDNCKQIAEFLSDSYIIKRIEKIADEK